MEDGRIPKKILTYNPKRRRDIHRTFTVNLILKKKMM
jgi:hypothetical protein